MTQVRKQTFRELMDRNKHNQLMGENLAFIQKMQAKGYQNIPLALMNVSDALLEDENGVMVGIYNRKVIALAQKWLDNITEEGELTGHPTAPGKSTHH